MNDFVVQARTPSFPFSHPADFVAELRPSNRHFTSTSTSPEPFGKSRTGEGIPLNPKLADEAPCRPSDDLDLALNHILANKTLSSDQLTWVLTDTVVKLIHTLLKGREVAAIQGSLRVLLAESAESIVVDLNEHYDRDRHEDLNEHYDRDRHEALNEHYDRDRREGPNEHFFDERESHAGLNVHGEQGCHWRPSSETLHGLTCKGPPVSPPSPPDGEEPLCTGSLCHFVDFSSSRRLPSPESSPSSSFSSSSSSSSSDDGSEDGGYHSPGRGRKWAESDKADSEEESGYSSSGRDSLSDAGAEEPLATPTSDPLGARFCYAFGPNAESHEPPTHGQEDSEESKLVIDLGVPSGDGDVRDVSETNGESPPAVAVDQVSASEEPPHDLRQPEDSELEFELKPEMMEDGSSSHNPSPSSEDVGVSECSRSQTTPPAALPALDAPIDLSGDCLVNERALAGIQVGVEVMEDSSTKELTCKWCPAVLKGTEQYQEHALIFHQQYACTTCFKEFSSKNNLKRHVRIHTGFRPYKCSQCSQSFSRKDDLKGHVLKHDYTKPFRCSLCKKGYTDRACVKNHMSKEHCSRLMHICPECGESFDRDDAFLEHKKSHPTLKQFSCKTCHYVGTNHLMAMKHTLLHSHQLFSCKPCNAYFADPFGYTKHVRKHKKTPEYTSYVCCFCKMVLATYEQFVRHEYSHAQGKLHECNTCKKQFRSKSLMLEHSQVHLTAAYSPEGRQAETKDPKTPERMETDGGDEPSIPDRYQPEEIPPLSGADRDIPDHQPDIPDHQPDIPDQCEGTLLDLSLKRPAALDFSRQGSPSPARLAHVATADNSGSRSLSLDNHCAPRNGCAAIEIRDCEQDKSAAADRGVGARGSDSELGEYQVVWKSPSLHDAPSTKPAENEARSTDLRSETPRSASGGSQEGSTLSEKPGFASAPSVIHHTSERLHQRSLRFQPYPKKQMDFACKFLAARGPRLFKEIGNTGNSPTLPSGTPSVEQASENGPTPLTPTSPGQDPAHTLKVGVFKTPSGAENANAPRPFAFPPPTILGLSGKPCLPGLESDNAGTGSCSSSGKTILVLKQEVPDDHPAPSPSSSSSSSSSSSPSSSSFSQKPVEPAYRLPGNEPATPTSTTTRRPGSSGCRQECDVCHETFESFFHLESHSVVCHNRYLCEFCGKGFTARPNRDRHVRYHTGERPYKCELCPSAFFRGDDLKYHRTTRHPTEQINCSRCSASFTWPKDLERHLRHSKCVA